MIISKIVLGAYTFCEKSKVPHNREGFTELFNSKLIAHDYLHYRFSLYLTGRYDDDERIEDLVEEIQSAIEATRSLEEFYEELEYLDGLVNYRKIKQKEYEVLNFIFNRF